MDLVEEFLELTRIVSVVTLVQLFKVLRSRIPGRHLPQNLKNLVDLTPQSGDPNNHARTFWRWLRKQSWRRMLPETVAVDVVLEDPGRQHPFYIEAWHIFLPSDMIASIYKYDWNLFKKRFIGPDGALEAYWESVKNTAWFNEHPVLSRPDCDLTKCIPLVVHGDDADSHRRRSFMICTVGSLLVGGSMWDSKLLCYVLDNSRAMGQTVATLDTWMTWSLMELQLGVFLDVDPWGRPYERHTKGRKGEICGGFKGILVCHKGDEKYIQKVYKTSHGAVSKNICILCMADSEPGHNLYTHHGLTAHHRTTQLSTSAFIQQIVGVRTWVNLPGFHVQFVQHDWLHVVDLTIIPECAASALVELSQEGFWGAAGTADERLRLGFVSFVSACRQARVKNRGMVFSMKHLYANGPKSYPSLAQKHFNAAESVVLAKWLEAVCLDSASRTPNNEHALLRAAVFINLVAMRRALSDPRNGWTKMDPTNLETLQRANFLFHSAVNWLACEALASQKLLWKIRPKYHKLDHLCYDSAVQCNPLKVACYMDEDAVGQVKRLASRAHPKNLAEQVLSRYAAYVCVRWLRQSTE